MMRRYIVKILVPIILVMLQVGCASRHVETIVLIPDDNGKVGEVVVRTRGGEQTLTRAGEAVQVQKQSKAPKSAGILSENDIHSRFAQALKARPLSPAQFILYFLPDSTKLDEPSKAKLPEVYAQAREREYFRVKVIGHTDTLGNAEHNARLALSRAEMIRDLLIERGVTADHIDVTSHGEGNLLVPTPDETDEPLNRRVEIFVQ